MADETEAGNIRCSMDAVSAKNLGRLAVRLNHVRNRRHDPARLRLAAHVGGKQRARPQRLAQDKAVAGLQSALAQRGCRRDETVTAKPSAGPPPPPGFP